MNQQTRQRLSEMFGPNTVIAPDGPDPETQKRRDELVARLQRQIQEDAARDVAPAV